MNNTTNTTSVFTNKCSAFSLITSPVTYCYGVLSVVAAAVAIGGNIVALFTIRSKDAREHPNIKALMTSLFISDELVGVIYLPFLVTRLFNTNYLHQCDFDKYGRVIGVVLTGNSTLIVACIAFNRYRLLATKKHAKSIVIKLYILFSCFVPVASAIVIGISKGDRFISPVFDALMLFLFAILPLICMAVCYVKIIVIVRNQQQKIHAHRQNPSGVVTREEKTHENKTTSQLEIQLSNKLAKLIMAYGLCLLPIVLIIAIEPIIAFITGKVISPENKVKQHFVMCATLVNAYNSSLNPLIYVSNFTEKLTKFVRTFMTRGSYDNTAL